MPQQLPLVPAVPSYRVGTTIAGTPYILDVRWNARDSAWRMDVLTDGEEMIASGLKLVLGAIIGGRRRSSDPRFPEGALIVVDLTSEGREATLEDMGERVQVLFYTIDELNEEAA